MEENKKHSVLSYAFVIILLTCILILSYFVAFNSTIKNKALYNEMQKYQDVLNEYIDKKIKENVNFKIETITASKEKIKEYIPKIKNKYLKDIEIQNGKIVYVDRDLKMRRELKERGFTFLEPCNQGNLLMWFSNDSKDIENIYKLKDLSRYNLDNKIVYNNERIISNLSKEGIYFNDSYLDVKADNLKYTLRNSSQITYEFNLTLPRSLSKSPLILGSNEGYLLLKIEEITGDISYEYLDDRGRKNKIIFDTSNIIKNNLGDTVHIVLTSSYKNNIQNFNLYINGKLLKNIKSDRTYNINMFDKSNSIYVGGNVNENYMTGTLNTIRIYNMELSLPEIEYNYKAII